MHRLKPIIFVPTILFRLSNSFSIIERGRNCISVPKTRCCAITSSVSERNIHSVNGINTYEVDIDIKHIGKVTILEATADSQDVLVEMAVALAEEKGDISSNQTLLHDDCYGSVLWPAASAVSDYLIENVSTDTDSNSLKGMTILELGTGTGLCSIVSCIGGAEKVMATDYESVPLRLLEYAATHLNDDCDEAKIETFLFDICNHDTPLPRADIVIAADIMYEPKTGIAMAFRAKEALELGSRVIIGCSPGRPGRPRFQEKLKELLPDIDTSFMDVEGRTCSGERHSLICGTNSTSVSERPKPLSVKLMDLKPSR
jgi:predicted nicotinamide N-methyase